MPITRTQFTKEALNNLRKKPFEIRLRFMRRLSNLRDFTNQQEGKEHARKNK